jgi:dihydroneopterin aldolase
MDKIKLNRIELWGSIGVLEEEKTGAQRYWISIEIEADLKPAGLSDQLEDTIDYSSVFDLCASLMQGSECDLIEAFAEELSCRMFQQFAIAQSVMIEILKPDAPMSGSFESVGIEIVRTRNG